MWPCLPALIWTPESVISAMEFHEKLHDMAMKEGLKGRKLHKSVESFTWNITILKVITAETLNGRLTPMKNSSPIWDDVLHIFYHKKILTFRCAPYDLRCCDVAQLAILNLWGILIISQPMWQFWDTDCLIQGFAQPLVE